MLISGRFVGFLGFNGISVFSLALAILVAASPIVFAQQGNVPPVLPELKERQDLEMKLDLLIKQDKFDELEKLADEFRRDKIRLASGYPTMGVFYNTVSEPLNADEWQWTDRIDRLQRWAKSKPDSVSARIALADAHIGYAWFARGGGWAGSVSEEGWRLFEERLAKAQAILEDAEKLPVKDPQLYAALIIVAKGRSQPIERVEELLKKSVAIDPVYHPSFFNLTSYLLPRWHGKPGDWAAFAEKAAEMTKKEEGDGMYARIVWWISGGTDELVPNEQFCEKNNVSWPKVKKGIADVLNRYPESLVYANRFCRLAAWIGDRETAHSLFERIGNRWSAESWGHQASFDAWKKWADPKTPEFLCKPQRILRVPSLWLTSVVFSPDGKTLAAGSEKAVVLWETATGRVKAVLQGHQGTISSLAYSPDGKILAVAVRPNDWTKPGEIRLWDATSGKLENTIASPAGPVHAVAFAPDGKTLISAGGLSKKPGKIRFWNVADAKEVKTIDSPNHELLSMALSSDGKTVIAGSHRVIWVWDEGSERPRSQLPGHTEWVRSVAVSPDGKLIAAGAGDTVSVVGSGEIKLWDAEKEDERPFPLNGHFKGVLSVSFSPDGELLATASVDSTIKIWHTATGNNVATLVGHWRRVLAVAFSPDGKTLSSAGEDGSVRLWDVSKLKQAK